MGILDEFPHECTIYSKQRRKDSVGGSSDVPVPVSTGVKCWEQAVSNTQSAEFLKRGFSDTRKVYFNYDPGLTEQNEIAITKRNGVTVSNPPQLAVISEATPDASAGLGILWRVEVHRLSGETQ